MARTDVIVLGAGIVGTSIALHLAKRGSSVALIERAGLGEQTSYGNAGVIEGNTVFPPAFPPGLAGAGAHRAQAGAARPITISRSCRRSRPGCIEFRAASQPRRLIENAQLIRPLFAHARWPSTRR